MNRKNLALPLVAILAAMSLLLELYVHFPVLPAASFLLYSPGDVPIILAAILVNPLAGVACAFVNATLFVLLTGQGGPWGALMHFISSGGMALVIGLLRRKTGKTWPVMCAGVATRVALMVPLNMLITPIYMGVPLHVVTGMIVPVIIPFNIIHGGLNTVLCYFLLRALPTHLLEKEIEKVS